MGKGNEIYVNVSPVEVNKQDVEAKYQKSMADVVEKVTCSALKVADRIVMLYPLSRLKADEPQVLFDGSTDEIARSTDKRVTQFVRGEAGERLLEMQDEIS